MNTLKRKSEEERKKERRGKKKERIGKKKEKRKEKKPVVHPSRRKNMILLDES